MYDTWPSHPLPLEGGPWAVGWTLPFVPEHPPPTGLVPHWSRLARAGEIVQHQDTAPVRICVLQGGCIELSIAGSGAGRFVLAFLAPGDAFGLEAILPGWLDPPVPEARALVASRLLVMPGPDARLAVERHPMAAAWMASSLAARAACAESVACVMAGPSVADRVLALLRGLATRWGRPGTHGTSIVLPIDQDLMAAAVGAARESVNRALRQLRMAGLVSRFGRTYILDSPPRCP